MLTGKVHDVQDGSLLAELSEGNQLAFDILYKKYWRGVVDEAYKRLGDKDQAKDIAQEVFTSMWTRATKKPIENLPAWLYTATKNNVYKLMQQQGRFVSIPDLLTELESYADRADAIILEKELIRAYNALVSSLPNQQRTIFKLRYHDELRPDEIAAKLNLSPKTVRNHLGRALTKFKTTFMLLQLLAILADK